MLARSATELGAGWSADGQLDGGHVAMNGTIHADDA